MTNLLTFIIPIRHPDTVADWGTVRRRLAETACSLAAQTSDAWQAVVVASRKADVPELSSKFTIVRVDLPPPAEPLAGASQEDLYEQIRADKGRRVLAGLLHVQPTGFVMVVDYDDFVSNRLADFVEQHPMAAGWYIRDGYLYDGSRALLRYPRGFNEYCGTSLIVRADLLKVPKSEDEASETYVRRWLGSHKFIDKDLQAGGTPLAPLPFPGAVYRIGHAGAESRSKSIRETAFPRWLLRKRPWEFARRLTRLRPLGSTLLHEFFAPNRGERAYNDIAKAGW